MESYGWPTRFEVEKEGVPGSQEGSALWSEMMQSLLKGGRE